MSGTHEFITLKQNFQLIIKRILKKDLSTNPLTLKRYETDVIEAYNEIAKYIDERYDNATAQETHEFKAEILYVREKILLCFGRLNLDYTLPNDLYEKLNETNLRDKTNTHDEYIDSENDMSDSNDSNTENLIGFSRKTDNATASGSGTQNSDGISNGNDNANLTEIIDQISNEQLGNHTSREPSREPSRHPSRQNSIENLTLDTRKMAHKENREYLKFAAQTINRNYAGDPLALKTFVNAVALLKATTEDDQMDLLKKFVVSRLEGKALECVNTKDTLENIMNSLEDSIKPDSSKVVEGKILSLRYNRSQANDFAEQANKLADALQRSLVIEGYSLEKAKEITIERTVEMCRQNARNEAVKSIIASKDFKDPREVVAKLIVEQTSQEKEKQVLYFNKGGFQKQNKQNYKRNGGHFKNKNQWNRSNNNGNNNSYRGRSNRGRFGNRGGGNRPYNVRMAENCDAPSGSRREDNTTEPQFTVERVSRN